MAGNKGRSSSASHKAYYGRYDYTAQRKKRLARHLKNHPNDAQAVEAHKSPSTRGPRPGQKLGWVDRKAAGFEGVNGPKEAYTAAWANSISRKAQRQADHYNKYTPKADRAKGGQAKA